MYRSRLVDDAATTFSATVGELCRAIRKLAAVTSPGEATQPLYRGVRGELPKSFWVSDTQGMVCAVECAPPPAASHRSALPDPAAIDRNAVGPLPSSTPCCPSQHGLHEHLAQPHHAH